jgi:hypothetical protein
LSSGAVVVVKKRDRVTADGTKVFDLQLAQNRKVAELEGIGLMRGRTIGSLRVTFLSSIPVEDFNADMHAEGTQHTDMEIIIKSSTDFKDRNVSWVNAEGDQRTRSPRRVPTEDVDDPKQWNVATFEGNPVWTWTLLVLKSSKVADVIITPDDDITNEEYEEMRAAAFVEEQKAAFAGTPKKVGP